VLEIHTITMLVYGWKLINITRGMLLMEFCPMVQTILGWREEE